MKQHPEFPWRVKLFVLSLLLAVLNSCSTENDRQPQVIADRITKAFAPDRREVLLDISVSQPVKNQLVLSGETNRSDILVAIVDSLTGAGYLVSDSVRILPDTLNNPAYMGLAALSVINLRRQPAHSAELVSQCIMGTPVMILREDDGWILVQTPDNYISWTEKSSVKPLTPKSLQDWNDSDRVVFISDFGLITVLPGSADVVGDLVAGAIMVKIGSRNGETEVLLPDGRSGFVRYDNLIDFKSFTSRSDTDGDDIIQRAARYTGLPYLWGGTSSKAVDCSGFVQSVYFMNGLILARDASLQAMNGIELDITAGCDKLQKGDLLFFGSTGPKGHRVTHVAICRGNNDFIHAASRVMVNSFDSTRVDYSPYRKKTLLSARRILGAEFCRGITPVANHKWYN